MGSPGKTESATVTTPPAASSAAAALPVTDQPPASCPSAAEIDERCMAWIEDPHDKARWQAFAQLSERGGQCGPQQQSSYEAVSVRFWEKFQKLSNPKCIDLVTALVQNMGPKAGRLEQEIVITAIARERPEVRDAIEREILSITDKQLESGARDVSFYNKCLNALADMRKQECKSDDDCYARHAKLFDLYKQYNSLIGSSINLCYRTFSRLAGEPLSQSNFCGRLTLDWYGRASANGTRTMAGGALTMATPGLTMIGARVGVANESTAFYVEGGYARLTSNDERSDLIPVEPSNPPVNSTHTAYRMREHDITRLFNGAYLAAVVEGSHPFKKDSPFSFVYDITGGFIMGGVADQPCSYAYKADEDSILATPNGNGGATATQTGKLTTTCRNSFSLGTMWGAGVGLRYRL